MTTDPSRPTDLKALWREQPSEASTVNLGDIRKKAQRFQRRKRIGNALEYFAAVLVIAAIMVPAKQIGHYLHACVAGMVQAG